MLTLSDIGHLPVPDQLFSYATAYLSASVVLCTKMKNDSTCCTWPNAAVVLLLAAHAIELFLKGVLLKRNVAVMDVQACKHSIDQLSAKYRETFQEESFTWEIPFTAALTKTEWIARQKLLNPDGTGGDLKDFLAASAAPSVLYRYPVDRDWNDWEVACGLEPTSFLPRLYQIESDFKRIRDQLG
jgi:hypothetical protein